MFTNIILARESFIEQNDLCSEIKTTYYFLPAQRDISEYIKKSKPLFFQDSR